MVSTSAGGSLWEFRHHRGAKLLIGVPCCQIKLCRVHPTAAVDMGSSNHSPATLLRRELAWAPPPGALCRGHCNLLASKLRICCEPSARSRKMLALLAQCPLNPGLCMQTVAIRNHVSWLLKTLPPRLWTPRMPSAMDLLGTTFIPLDGRTAGSSDPELSILVQKTASRSSQTSSCTLMARRAP